MYKKFGVIQELRCILLFNTKLINNPQVVFIPVKISKKRHTKATAFLPVIHGAHEMLGSRIEFSTRNLVNYFYDFTVLIL